MTPDSEINPTARRPITLSPWLVALAGLALYGLTLNHWATFRSLTVISQIAGWDWHPSPLLWRPYPEPPLFFVLTLPLRLLPAAWRPMGANIFTAVCAALTLAVLARSVRLMSHDRTREQRLREGGEYALLSVRWAFLPAVFAVAMLAGEMNFWEDSIAASGAMLDTLVFGFLIYCLLDYRISQNEWRLNLFAFVYGLGVTNNWALIGFFPCFLVAMVWIKKLSFFNWKFVLRILGFGLLGLLLYLLTPLLGAMANEGGFWPLLHMEWSGQAVGMRSVPRFMAIIAGVPTLLPLLFAAIKWPSFEGELSAGAHDLTRWLFCFLHFIFLALGVWMFFDSKSSPSPRAHEMAGFLTFYYLAALNIGYFSGYILLVFGKDPAHHWGRAVGFVKGLNWTVIGLLWAAAIGLPSWLFYQNFPHIKADNSGAFAKLAAELARSLPNRPVIVLSDDPIRLHLVAGECQRLGKSDQYIFIDTESFPRKEYMRYLASRYPHMAKTLIAPDKLPERIDDGQMIDLVDHLIAKGPVYYLHPSFGYYFERAYMIPHGLGGDMNVYSTNNEALPAVPTLAEIKENQAFWEKLQKEDLASLPDEAKLSVDARVAAMLYAQAINYWGVQIQMAATLFTNSSSILLKAASEQFAEALRLDPYNVMASLNRQYNASLRGAPPPAGPVISVAELQTQIPDWDLVLKLEGPADEPDMDLLMGRHMAQGGLFEQAVRLFQRCLQMPGRHDSPDAELDLAKTYVDMGSIDAGLEMVRRIRSHPGAEPAELARVEALAYTKKGEFQTAENLLLKAHQRNPKDENYMGLLVEFYRIMGYTALHKSNTAVKEQDKRAAKAESQAWFKRSLAAIDEQWQLLNSPTHSSANISDKPDNLLRKAEMLMMLTNYPEAIATLTQVEEMLPDNPAPVLNRAIAELQANRLDNAKADYLVLKKKLHDEPNYLLYYGLFQVAQKQNDRAGAIENARLYIKYAPRPTPEYSNVTLQLQKLEGH